MNSVQLAGRLTRDPELRTTASGVSVCSFTLAVNRRFKNADGEYETDFINCIAWRQSADNLCKYRCKGDTVGVVGAIQTRNYEKDGGQRVYITEVLANEIHFFGKSNKAEQPASQDETTDVDFSAFAPAPADGDLPF